MTMKSTDYRSNWTCTQGHSSGTYLILVREDGEMRILGGSSWDYCDECSETPAAGEVIRMRLEILEQWAGAGLITSEEQAEMREKMGDESGVRTWAERMESAMKAMADGDGTEEEGCLYPHCPEDGAESWYRQDPETGRTVRTRLCLEHDAMVPRDDRGAQAWLSALAKPPAP